MAPQGNSGLRVAVLPGGCSGFQHGLNVEEEPEADDDDSPVDVPCEVEYDCFYDPSGPEVEFHKIELIPGSEDDDVEMRGIPRDHPQLFETG